MTTSPGDGTVCLAALHAPHRGDRVEDVLDRAVGCADHGSERSEVRWNGEELCERHLGGEIAATGVDVERRRSHAINIGDR